MTQKTKRISATRTRTMHEHITVGYRGREITLVATGQQVQRLAENLYDIADGESGIIAASDMVHFFPGQPALHTATSLYRALLAAGCTEEK